MTAEERWEKLTKELKAEFVHASVLSAQVTKTDHINGYIQGIKYSIEKIKQLEGK